MSSTGSEETLRRTRSGGKRKKKLGKTAKAFLIATSVVVALAVAATAVAGWFVYRLANSFDTNSETITNAFPEEELRPEKREDNAQTILLIGSDKDGDIDETVFTGPQDSRSDVIMVVRIPADRSSVNFVSIMRDSWVDIPGFGPNKVNAALAYGGVPLAVQTLEALLDTRIDQVAVIDFQGFKSLTDALGGVTVNNQNTFSAGGFDFPQGEITLTGEQALSFVRERKSFEDGDYQRVRNQQAYMKAVAKELLSQETLTSPATIMAVVDELSPYLAVSEGFDVSYLLKMAPSLRNIRSSDISFMTAPTAGVGTSDDGQSIILLDDAKMDELRAAFANDTVAEFIASN